MKQLFENFKDRLIRIEKNAQKRNWIIRRKLVLEESSAIEEVLKIEKELGRDLPNEYVELLTSFSRRVEFSYQIEGVPNEFGEIFSGEIGWDISRIKELCCEYESWLETSLDPRGNDLKSIEITNSTGINKTPLMRVPNGDFIVIDNDTNEVFYLDHEGDVMHGKRLGKTLFEFLDKWTQVGLIGSEGWQFEALYNFDENDIMEMDNVKVQKWKEWVGLF